MYNLILFIGLWLYYSKFYILGAIFLTYLLNKLTRKLYYPPLIINMVSSILLLLTNVEKRTENMYLYYMPVVFTSIVMNTLIYIFRRRKYGF